MAEQFRRKSPEEILQSISKMHRGRLKIILGAVSGSGKTYHLLMEGQSLKKKGIDVVVGMLGTATRPKLAEQLEGLEKVPAISWIAQSEEKCDLDVAAIVARDPEVVLVDGLAHRNRADAPRQTRLDDVLYLLNRNISVIATVNVYELAGMKELAERLTKAEVRIDQCVPEDTLALADEVKLLDVTPESMLKRLEEGNIEAAQTPNLLFRRDNLHVLRSLPCDLSPMESTRTWRTIGKSTEWLVPREQQSVCWCPPSIIGMDRFWSEEANRWPSGSAESSWSFAFGHRRKS